MSTEFQRWLLRDVGEVEFGWPWWCEPSSEPEKEDGYAYENWE